MRAMDLTPRAVELLDEICAMIGHGWYIDASYELRFVCYH